MPSEAFESAVSRVESLTKRPTNETLLQLYGLYKQATAGDNPDSSPSSWDIKEMAKHSAWASRRGMTQAQAEQAYIQLAEQLTKAE